jgi:hypothetical protein
MESVSKARARLAAYPKLIASCSGEAAVYAACVTKSMGEVKKDQCKEEFDAFKKCVAKAAKKAGTRL